MELYALKLGLKNNKLAKDWSMLAGFALKEPLLKSSLKDKALSMIKAAFEKHRAGLEDARKRMESSWSEINKGYWTGMERALEYRWQSGFYNCYLSLVCNGGFHNSSKNFIIVQYRWDKISNYVVAHELFHIFFRNFVNSSFKEKYDYSDEDLSEVLVNFILLSSPVRELFPKIKFSFEIYGLAKHRELAKRLFPLWQEQKPFKDFLIDSYHVLGREKKWIRY